MYTFKKITQDESLIIANKWHYGKPCNFYNLQANEEDYKKFIHPETRKNTYSVFNAKHDLIGYITFSIDDEIEMD